jgi:hypothetical protein
MCCFCCIKADTHVLVQAQDFKDESEVLSKKAVELNDEVRIVPDTQSLHSKFFGQNQSTCFSCVDSGIKQSSEGELGTQSPSRCLRSSTVCGAGKATLLMLNIGHFLEYRLVMHISSIKVVHTT